MENELNRIISFVREYFATDDFIPLHEPKFIGNEKKYLSQCIDSTFVSYLGEYVKKAEEHICELTGSKYGVVVSSGTAALHMGLLGVGVEENTEVITQGLSFVATANAIKYTGAEPIFIDVEREHLGLSYDDLKKFLIENVEVIENSAFNKNTSKKITACVPVHIFGHPVDDIDKIIELCEEYRIPVVEDAAESLGSYYKNKHTGRFGKVGVFSFNGNKVITSGGGGMIITDDEEVWKKIIHISTTAKLPHKWKYYHDVVGYNYRMPNLNAAVLLAQLEQLPHYIESKKELARRYKSLFADLGIEFINESKDSKPNYWLNAVILKNATERDLFLEKLNNAGIMARPCWDPLAELPPFKKCQRTELQNVNWLVDRVVNIPSSVRIR